MSKPDPILCRCYLSTYKLFYPSLFVFIELVLPQLFEFLTVISSLLGRFVFPLQPRDLCKEFRSLSLEVLVGGVQVNDFVFVFQALKYFIICLDLLAELNILSMNLGFLLC